MPEPERTLRELVQQIEDRVRDTESEIADFERRARIYLESLKDSLVRDTKRLELFRSEMNAMAREERTPDPLKPAPAARKIETAERESQSARIREAAKAILSRAGRPLMQNEIKNELDRQGIVIVARDVAELVRAALRRHPSDFRHVKGQGWILVDAANKTE